MKWKMKSFPCRQNDYSAVTFLVSDIWGDRWNSLAIHLALIWVNCNHVAKCSQFFLFTFIKLTFRPLFKLLPHLRLSIPLTNSSVSSVCMSMRTWKDGVRHLYFVAAVLKKTMSYWIYIYWLKIHTSLVILYTRGLVYCFPFDKQ